MKFTTFASTSALYSCPFPSVISAYWERIKGLSLAQLDFFFLDFAVPCSAIVPPLMLVSFAMAFASFNTFYCVCLFCSLLSLDIRYMLRNKHDSVFSQVNSISSNSIFYFNNKTALTLLSKHFLRCRKKLCAEIQKPRSHRVQVSLPTEILVMTLCQGSC